MELMSTYEDSKYEPKTKDLDLVKKKLENKYITQLPIIHSGVVPSVVIMVVFLS